MHELPDKYHPTVLSVSMRPNTESPSDWMYRSAGDYEGKMGLIDIHWLDLFRVKES